MGNGPVLLDSPERFDDQLDMYVHRRVYGGDWDLLSRDFTDRGELWPDPIRAQTALILAFAASEGRLSDSGRDIGSYLEIALGDRSLLLGFTPGRRNPRENAASPTGKNRSLPLRPAHP